MRWVTRKCVHVNRAATGWLIRRFLDPGAEILFVEPETVAAIQETNGAIGFDAPGAAYPHRESGRMTPTSSSEHPSSTTRSMRT